MRLLFQLRVHKLCVLHHKYVHIYQFQLKISKLKRSNAWLLEFRPYKSQSYVPLKIFRQDQYPICLQLQKPSLFFFSRFRVKEGGRGGERERDRDKSRKTGRDRGRNKKERQRKTWSLPGPAVDSFYLPKVFGIYPLLFISTVTIIVPDLITFHLDFSNSLLTEVLVSRLPLFLVYYCQFQFTKAQLCVLSHPCSKTSRLPSPNSCKVLHSQ